MEVRACAKARTSRPRTRFGPVYRQEAAGSPVVPTGRVFVRFVEELSAADQRAGIEEAGYRIVEVPDYAPHAAWVESRSGRMADALRGIGALAAIPGVENVEPQLLGPSARK